MVFEPARYILPGYIAEGATIIAGKPKMGKSWLTLDIAIAATAGRFTLGTLKPTRACSASIESGDSRETKDGRIYRH
jgi:RecA-family ATPase